MAARIVLVGELFVVLFAGLVARGLSDASGYTVLWVCLGVVALCVAAMATLNRGIVGFVLGSIVQVAAPRLDVLDPADGRGRASSSRRSGSSPWCRASGPR